MFPFSIKEKSKKIFFKGYLVFCRLNGYNCENIVKRAAYIHMIDTIMVTLVGDLYLPAKVHTKDSVSVSILLNNGEYYG